MIKYKIRIDVESTGEYPDEARKRTIEIESVYNDESEEDSHYSSFFWCFGEDMADAVDAISNIVPPQYDDFITGVKDGLLDKSPVWESEVKND